MASENGVIENGVVTGGLTGQIYGHGTYNIFTMVPNKINRDNYLVWRNQFECALRMNKFMKYINGTESCPAPKMVDDTDNPTYKKRIAKDDLVLGWIKGIVQNSIS